MAAKVRAVPVVYGEDAGLRGAGAEMKRERRRKRMHRGAAEKVLLHHSPRRAFSWSGQRGAASVLQIKGMRK